MKVMKYLVVIEKGPKSYGAYVPDLPGCVAVGTTRAEVRKLIREAIDFHLEGMAEDGLKVPTPTSIVDYVNVEAPSRTTGRTTTRRRAS